jgi:hypothetical protein
MPYIKQELRPDLDKIIEKFSMDLDESQLDYIFTRLAHRFVHQNGLRFSVCNRIFGVFMGAGLEFYRRILGPYEDQKIEENGAVGLLDTQLNAKPQKGIG